MSILSDLEAFRAGYLRRPDGARGPAPEPKSKPRHNLGGNVAGSTRPGHNKTGLPKHVYRSTTGRYTAKVRFHGEAFGCGTYDTPEEAARAAMAKVQELKGRP